MNENFEVIIPRNNRKDIFHILDVMGRRNVSPRDTVVNRNEALERGLSVCQTCMAVYKDND